MSKKNSTCLEEFFEYSLDMEERVLYMGSIANDEESEPGTDAAMAEFAIKGLLKLDRKSDEPITIIMNNPGGDEVHGMSIYDAIKTCRSKITIKVFGHAMSMGSIILQAADDRVLAPNASVMIHYGTSIVADPSLHEMEQQTWSAESRRFRKQMVKLYAEAMKLSESKVKRLLAYATIYTAAEAVNAGLADRVLSLREGL